MAGRCPRWVNFGSRSPSAQGLLSPQERTSSDHGRMSVWCQHRKLPQLVRPKQKAARRRLFNSDLDRRGGEPYRWGKEQKSTIDFDQSDDWSRVLSFFYDQNRISGDPDRGDVGVWAPLACADGWTCDSQSVAGLDFRGQAMKPALAKIPSMTRSRT
jgi:hypothetical protein